MLKDYKEMTREEMHDYIQALEGELFELKDTLGKNNIESNYAKLLISDILTSSNTIINMDKKDDRMTNDEEEVDYKKAIINLNEYIKKYIFDCHIKL